jgi:predicted Holliday junction resolvase-like endonuclease
MEPLDILFLFILCLISSIIAFLLGQYIKDKQWESKITDLRKDAIKKSRAVIGGQFSEQLAPYLPDFPYLPTEAKFLGKPIDLIIFRGSDEKKISAVIFVEIKSGKAKLSPQEKELKKAIEEKRVRWVEYRIPEHITG